MEPIERNYQIGKKPFIYEHINISCSKYKKVNNPNKPWIIFTNRRIISIFLNIILIIFIIEPKENRYNKSNFSSIHITINSKGNQRIFARGGCKENSYILPDHIYVNGELKEGPISNVTFLNGEKNNVTLALDEAIIITACLFNGCHNIAEVDLSDFNTEQLQFIHGMFWHCKSLTSINFFNFNTSHVVDMHYLFTDCAKLANLDLSNFDTSLVTNMGHMFDGCNSLKSLNISNFKTSNLKVAYNMFERCESLSFLVSNFDTSEVTNMQEMFSNCISLYTLNYLILIPLK